MRCRAAGSCASPPASSEVDGALQVELSVADEGRGIDEADRPHIFEPFYTTRRDAGGTGLGLATVLGTAEQHGGTVRVDARPSGGSVFTIVAARGRVAGRARSRGRGTARAQA